MRFLIFCLLYCGLSLAVGAQTVNWQHQPGSGEQVRTLQPKIMLSWPLGTPLPYRQARMWLDGREIQDGLVRTSLLLAYTPEEALRRGKHTVQVQVGERTQEWEFEVVGVSLITGAVMKTPPQLKPFDKIEVEVRGEVQGQAWAAIVGFPEKYILKEKQRGNYRGTFKAPAKLAGQVRQLEVFLQKGAQLDRLEVPGGRLTVAAANLTVALVSPEANSKVERQVRIEGETLPDHEVEISAKAFFRDGIEFGPLPEEMRRTVRADEHGKFSFIYEFPTGLPRLGVSVVAVAKDEARNHSVPATLVLYLGPSGSIPPLHRDTP